MKGASGTFAFLFISFCALAQQAEPAPESEAQPQVQEEIVITGERLQYQLRQDMRDAEQAAYDLFNQFNDDKRFEISCNTQTPVGSRIESANLLCQPNFEAEAMRGAGQDYLTSLRNFMDPYTEDKSPPPSHAPAHALIEALQGEYRAKMREVAEQHPEFLQALIEYSNKQARYRASLGQQDDAASD